MSSLFEQVCDSIALATRSLQQLLPEETTSPEQIAAVLEQAGLDRGTPYSDLRDRLATLYLDHRLGGHLAALSAVEGDIRDLTQRAVDSKRYISDEKLRGVLADYGRVGMPDRLRSLLEQLFAAAKLKRDALNAWHRLLDYRNWLAHGRRGSAPRGRLPTQHELEQEIKAAMKSVRTATQSSRANRGARRTR